MNVNIRVVVKKNIINSLLYDWTINISKVTEQVAYDVIDEMQRLFEEPKSGNIYWYNGSNYQASAPGEPPAIRSGFLYDSFRVVKVNQYAWGIRSMAPYAELLEFGGVYIYPRPYIRPAAENTAKDFKNSVIQVFGRGFTKGE